MIPSRMVIGTSLSVTMPLVAGRSYGVQPSARAADGASRTSRLRTRATRSFMEATTHRPRESCEPKGPGPLETRRTLLEEGGDALAAVGRARHAADRRGLLDELVGEGRRHRGAQQALDLAVGAGRPGGERFGEVARRGLELRVGPDA